jgi:triosephosphate isomerase
MPKLLVANFKSYTVNMSVWIEAFTPLFQARKGIEVVVTPHFLDLSGCASRLPAGLALGAQDVSPFPAGAYTGSIPAAVLKERGVRYVIVGHSERRHYFHETTSDVARKIHEACEVGLTPIVCLEEADIIPQFATLSDAEAEACYFCYEPSVDIGGTVTAPRAQIERVTAAIRQHSGGRGVMYGGSVTAANVEELVGLNLAGFIVATASLDPVQFGHILTKVAHGTD